MCTSTQGTCTTMLLYVTTKYTRVPSCDCLRLPFYSLTCLTPLSASNHWSVLPSPSLCNTNWMSQYITFGDCTFHSVLPCSPFKLLYKSIPHSFLLMPNIPYHDLFNHLCLKDTWAVLSSHLFCIKLPCRFTYRFLYENKFSLLGCTSRNAIPGLYDSHTFNFFN